MAIHRTSANVVPAVLNPVTKLSRVAKFGSGSSKSASATQAPVQAPGSQPTNTPRTAKQVHAAFENARAALSNTAADTTAQSSQPDQSQNGVVQQADGTYGQVAQASGQTLDITA
ncbi:MAG: hypothetical protein ACLP9L_01910 [Thermoguttaceae bacterium]